MTTIQIETVGRRHYIVGNTYPIKDRLRTAGCKWDSERKAWWTGKAETAQQFAGVESATPSYVAPADEVYVSVSGNTYPVRDQLRELGGRWDAASKTWQVPASKAEAAHRVVASAPTAAPRTYRRASNGMCRGCRGPIVNAPHGRAMGGYCGSCAYDEF